MKHMEWMVETLDLDHQLVVIGEVGEQRFMLKAFSPEGRRFERLHSAKPHSAKPDLPDLPAGNEVLVEILKKAIVEWASSEESKDWKGGDASA